MPVDATIFSLLALSPLLHYFLHQYECRSLWGKQEGFRLKMDSNWDLKRFWHFTHALLALHCLYGHGLIALCFCQCHSHGCQLYTNRQSFQPRSALLENSAKFSWRAKLASSYMHMYIYRGFEEKRVTRFSLSLLIGGRDRRLRCETTAMNLLFRRWEVKSCRGGLANGRVTPTVTLIDQVIIII